MEILILPLAFLAMWMLLIRPQQKRQREQLALVQAADIGDEIVTAGGFVVTIMDTHDPEDDGNGLRPDEVLVAFSEDLEVVMRRRSIAEIRNKWDGEYSDGTFADDADLDDEADDEYDGDVVDADSDDTSGR